MTGPISAFARRKAARTQLPQESNLVETPAALTQPDEDVGPVPVPSAKRRKQGRDSKPTSAPPEEPLTLEVVPNEDGSASRQASHTSDSEGGAEDSSSDSVDHKQSKAPTQMLSKYSSKSTLLSDTDATWAIRLHPNDNLAILGQYDLWVRSGAVSIFGAIIHASPTLHRVYAPSTHSLPSIRPVSNPFGSGNPPCEVFITSCGSRIRLLGHISPRFGRIWNGPKSTAAYQRSFANIANSVDDPYKRALRLLETPADWQARVSRLVSSDHLPSAVMVCGPKGAGKSTFCRNLVNALIPMAPVDRRAGNDNYNYDGIMFLDLDPGQPEYSPPGELSLLKVRSHNFGPPYAHPVPNENDQMIKAYHFGHLSPREDPSCYYKCALDLLECFREVSVKDDLLYPLVINCSGWVQGIGLEILAKLVQNLGLSDVIYMSTTGPAEVVDVLNNAATNSNVALHQLTSQASDITTRTAADLRMMQTLSYFHLNEPEGGNLRWNPSPLSSIRPMVVHYIGSKQDLFGVMILGDKQNPDFLETILEGCIVGVVAIDDDMVIQQEVNPESDMIPGFESDIENSFSTESSMYETPEVRRNAAGIPYIAPRNQTVLPLPPEHYRSLGQALIRGIDTKNGTFQLLTPIPSSTFTAIPGKKRLRIALVRGKLDTPTWAYMEQYEFEKAGRRRREKELGVKEDYGPDDVRKWAERQPWASVVDGGRSGSGKVRKVRRDIRYKGQKDVRGSK